MAIKKKHSQAEREQQIESTLETEPIEKNTDLRATLEKIKDRDGVIGYILRASTSASIDLKDPSKIIDYAVLSATVIESGENLTEAFELGKINSIILEGKEAKILSFSIGEQQLSVFMEKNVDPHSVYRDLTQST